jgi:hypothetical protein
MAPINFLIGRGEMLTHELRPPRKKPTKIDFYSWDDTVERLGPDLRGAVASLDALPENACPGEIAVARFTLNPSYIARSFFPSHVLREEGLESVGSRTVRVTPRKWAKKGRPTDSPTTEIFVAGKRAAFRRFATLASINPESTEALDLRRIEHIRPFEPAERIANGGQARDRFFEVAIHLMDSETPEFIEESFRAYAKSVGFKLHDDLAFEVGSLWFVPVEGPQARLSDLAKFSLMRVVRPVPLMRGLPSVGRAVGLPAVSPLPTSGALSSEPRVAILDGGLPAHHHVAAWATQRKLNAAGDFAGGPEHGLGVTSAFLFGPILPGVVAQKPYSNVDHVRVLDGETSLDDPLKLYRSLALVEEVLLSRQYEFINLSLGPDLPVEDQDVHPWTSLIDSLLSDGNTFMTVAIGNNGERDRASGNARVQVPSDSVNAVAVGSADETSEVWKRAPYSAVGPGRMPGVVKPDLLAFGGSAATKYFHVLAPGTPGSKPTIAPNQGTSFAAPYLLRKAVGIRAILGTEMSPLVIKALMVDAAQQQGYDKEEVGWGKVPDEVMSIITCPAGTARIVYQGELLPGKYLRAPVPLPATEIPGFVTLGATFCYASPIDPQDAAAYTRAGLEVTFRPDVDDIKAGKQTATTRGFFDLQRYSTEQQRRADLGKWETVLHDRKRMRGAKLRKPAFDIHYNARAGGGRASGPGKIRYALIISMEAPKHPNLYADILSAYASTLIPIQPTVTLPIRL